MSMLRILGHELCSRILSRVPPQKFAHMFRELVPILRALGKSLAQGFPCCSQFVLLTQSTPLMSGQFPYLDVFSLVWAPDNNK